MSGVAKDYYYAIVTEEDWLSRSHHQWIIILCVRESFEGVQIPTDIGCVRIFLTAHLKTLGKLDYQCASGPHPTR